MTLYVEGLDIPILLFIVNLMGMGIMLGFLNNVSQGSFQKYYLLVWMVANSSVFLFLLEILFDILHTVMKSIQSDKV